MTNKYMKRWPVSLIVMDIQIKVTRRYHLPSVRMTIIKKIKEKSSGENVDKLEIEEHVENLKYWNFYAKTIWRCFKKLKIQLSYDPATLLLSTFSK